jgi:hypothetical protein
MLLVTVFLPEIPLQREEFFEGPEEEQNEDFFGEGEGKRRE